MAGIKEAMKRVMEHRNVGFVVAEGYLKECQCNENVGSNEIEHCGECEKIHYIIIRLKHDDGLITQYDYKSDIRISCNINVRDEVILMLNDNWNATWMRTKDTKFSPPKPPRLPSSPKPPKSKI